MMYLYRFCLYGQPPIPAGTPNPTREDAPEGFTVNYITIFKWYFCKYACEKAWDDFYEENVLMNEELRNNARAVLNEQTEEEFHNALYDSNSDYARLVRYVLEHLVSQGLLNKQKQQGRDSIYWRTDKLKELCPDIIRVQLPVIDSLVDEYDRQHQQ